MMDNCFEWYSSECTPAAYPAEIVEGFFILYNGIKHEILHGQYCQNCWGEVGAEFYLGSDIKPVPAYLSIRYISFVECKVYSGEAYFDKDFLIPLFQKQILSPVNNNAIIQYNRIIIGTAPLGFVSIWLYGDTNALELLQFQCSEDHDFKIDSYVVGYKDLNDYSQRILSDKSPEIVKAQNTLSIQSIPTKWSDIYRMEISLQLEFHLLGEIESFQVWFFNGESKYHFPADKKNVYPLIRMPSKIKINWKNDDDDFKMSVFPLDEESIFSNYNDFNEFPKENRLIIQLRENNNLVKAWMKNRQHVVEIKKEY